MYLTPLNRRIKAPVRGKNICEYPRDRAEWVDPVPARRSWGHIPSAAQVPSQRSLPHPALHSS